MHIVKKIHDILLKFKNLNLIEKSWLEIPLKTKIENTYASKLKNLNEIKFIG